MKKKPVVGKGLLAAPLLVGSDKNEQQHHSVPARGVGGFQKIPKHKGAYAPSRFTLNTDVTGAGLSCCEKRGFMTDTAFSVG